MAFCVGVSRRGRLCAGGGLAAVLGVDLDEAVTTKLASNARRYPVEQARGKNDKSMLR